MEMTKADLRMLAQLPQMIAVLRKLAAQTDELRGLAATLNMGPTIPAELTARGQSLQRMTRPAPPEPDTGAADPDLDEVAKHPPMVWVCNVCGDHLPSQSILDAHLTDVHQGTNEAKNAERRLDRQAEVRNNGVIKSALLTQFGGG
jgi:hypothetical protein